MTTLYTLTIIDGEIKLFTPLLPGILIWLKGIAFNLRHINLKEYVLVIYQLRLENSSFAKQSHKLNIPLGSYYSEYLKAIPCLQMILNPEKNHLVRTNVS